MPDSLSGSTASCHFTLRGEVATGSSLSQQRVNQQFVVLNKEFINKLFYIRNNIRTIKQKENHEIKKFLNRFFKKKYD